MAEYAYPAFKHGAYGEVVADGIKLANAGPTKQAIVYIGTAPVGQVAGGAQNVNKPILVKNMSEAKKYLGYSDDFAKYTLCEAMKVHFDVKGVGPLVFINVLNPTTHRIQAASTVSLTPMNGRVTIVGTEDIILDSIVITNGVVGEGAKTYVLGTDYTLAFDYSKMNVIVTETESGKLGTNALSITYNKMDATAVQSTDVIGSTDNYGLNTGIYTIKNVYNLTGYVPAFILAPGWSSVKAIHDVMWENSQSIGAHWNAWMFVDMPLTDSLGAQITLQSAPTWKANNGYNKDNESVFFPLALGTDGKKYHISVLNCANFQELLIENRGIPYMTGSNTVCNLIEDLYFGESWRGRIFDDEIINRTLNCNGIDSAAFVGGKWVIWGMFAGSYNQDDATTINVFDTCLMMLYYITNDFQHRRNVDIDKPMPINDLKQMVAEEQARIDALLGIGALTYGQVELDASEQARSDIYSGDFRILFNVTNTPLAKSLTAIANWTANGYEIYFQAMEEQTEG